MTGMNNYILLCYVDILLIHAQSKVTKYDYLLRGYLVSSATYFTPWHVVDKQYSTMSSRHGCGFAVNTYTRARYSYILGHDKHKSFCSRALNTLRPRQQGRRFADDTFKRIFLNENVKISIKISLKFVPKGPINHIPALVQIMAWRRSGDKPLSGPMMVRLPTHICVTRPQWVKLYHTFILLGFDLGVSILPVHSIPVFKMISSLANGQSYVPENDNTNVTMIVCFILNCSSHDWFITQHPQKYPLTPVSHFPSHTRFLAVIRIYRNINPASQLKPAEMICPSFSGKVILLRMPLVTVKQHNLFKMCISHIGH